MYKIFMFLLCFLTMNSFLDAKEHKKKNKNKDFEKPIYQEPLENNAKIFVSTQGNLYFKMDEHLYEITNFVHSWACEGNHWEYISGQ